MTDPEIRVCAGCGKDLTKSYRNHCNWDCIVKEARDAGGREYLPNGLPVLCVRADNMMLECEHGDHVDYKSPVEAARVAKVTRPEDDPRELFKDLHALIYTDTDRPMKFSDKFWTAVIAIPGLVYLAVTWPFRNRKPSRPRPRGEE